MSFLALHCGGVEGEVSTRVLSSLRSWKETLLNCTSLEQDGSNDQPSIASVFLCTGGQRSSSGDDIFSTVSSRIVFDHPGLLVYRDKAINSRFGKTRITTHPGRCSQKG